MAGLSERVVQTVLDEGATRRRREKMLFRIRAPLSLVAAFLLIALVAAVFIGGRLIQDWNALHNGSPAGQRSEERRVGEGGTAEWGQEQADDECVCIAAGRVSV